MTVDVNDTDAPEQADWLAANQQALAAALESLRTRLAARGGGDVATRDPVAQPAPALDRLCAAFALSAFERDVVLLAAGCELSSTFAGTVADVNGGRPYPTFGMALTAGAAAHWSALSPGAPLRAWKLVDCIGDGALAQREIRLDEQVLHWITGVAMRDERLAGVVVPAPPPAVLAPTHAALAERIAGELRAAAGQPLALVELVGSDSETCLAIAAAAAMAIEQPLALLDAANVPSLPAERQELAVRIARSRVLFGEALFLRGQGREAELLLALLQCSPGLVFVERRDAAAAPAAQARRYAVEHPGADEQRLLVEEALARAGADGESADALRLQLGAAPRLVDELARALRSSGDALSLEATLGAARRALRERLGLLARRIEPRARWDDLAVPAHTRYLLGAIVSQVRHRARVHDDWGFAAKSARGLGLCALFEGDSGTGKTMAAEVIAAELGLDLFHVDLSGVVSKYIGETEKNLAALFEAAEGSGAILFFDEADALFGKRSEVRDSHDRYANIEVSYLLQRMESYRGVSILTTNLRSALDTAFLRRIRFVVKFPHPDAATRADIWRRVFPAATPTDALDAGRLAQLNVPGGTIRNIALTAAFLAAQRGTAVGMQHLADAARLEYSRLERPLSEAETRGWVRAEAAS